MIGDVLRSLLNDREVQSGGLDSPKFDPADPKLKAKASKVAKPAKPRIKRKDFRKVTSAERRPHDGSSEDGK